MGHEEYYHPKHGKVIVTAKYSDIWMIIVEGVTKSVAPNSLTKINGHAGTGTETAGTDINNVLASASADLNISSVTVIRINAEDTTVDLLTDTLPMIGLARAKHIVDNRPERGYQNWNHFKQANEEYISINWDAFKLSLEENMIKFDYS